MKKEEITWKEKKSKMKIILSPAKKMKIDTDILPPLGLPIFLEKTEEILSWMKKQSYEELKSLWKCNEKIALENYQRFQEMDLEKQLTPAILAYEGIAYQYMAPAVFEENHFAEQIDVVPATILMYEQNKHPVSFDVANSLADVLDVNADLLYDDFAVFLSASYSETLKDIRISTGMSQRAFAEHIGVIPSYFIYSVVTYVL